MTLKGDVLNQLNMASVTARVVGKTLTTGAGTAGNGTVDVTATPTQATINNNFATLVAQVNAMRSVLVAAGLMD